jgi:hypothetical protein
MLSSLFKKWRKPSVEIPPEVSEESSLREQIRDWQRVLAEEQGRLGHDLTELLATYERSLNYFAAHVHELDPASLQKEYQSLERIRGVLGNAIRRLEVSTKDDHELLEEWREWQALQELGRATLDPTQSQRQEMVRSELMIRGKLPSRGEVVAASSVAVTPSPTAAPVAPLPHLRTVFIEEAFDDLDDWHEIYHRELEAARPHWQERLEDAIAHADADPVYAAAIVARVRAWHGDRKRLRK